MASKAVIINLAYARIIIIVNDTLPQHLVFLIFSLMLLFPVLFMQLLPMETYLPFLIANMCNYYAFA